MKVIIFGATGMVGQGVLRECLEDPEVTQVLAIGRNPTGVSHSKLRESQPTDLYDLSPIANELTGWDACFFCLGVSSVGMSAADYQRVTYDLTLHAAQMLAERNPGMGFAYVSGQGTDSTERGRVRWARVKGATENALLKLPIKAYLFRPRYIHPMNGTTSKTRLYRALYVVVTPLYPLLRRLAPRQITTTQEVGRAMIRLVRDGAPSQIVNPADINAAAAR